MMRPLPRLREIGDVGRCEAVDFIPTSDDAEAVQCVRRGRVIREHDHDGHTRLRCVCGFHGYDTAMEVN